MLCSMQDFASMHVIQQTTTQSCFAGNYTMLTLYKYVWLLYFIIIMTAIEKSDTKSFWHGFTETHFKIL